LATPLLQAAPQESLPSAAASNQAMPPLLAGPIDASEAASWAEAD